jgi:ribosomal protein S12 methylthiotransferase
MYIMLKLQLVCCPVSLYPDEITPGLIDIMESDPRICRYLDMPIQHSHDAILKQMRRKTNLAQIEDTIETLRRRLPGIHIRTSLMAGFPGETEEQFEHLLNFVKKQKLENVGVFQYSDEKLAYSSRLLNHVPEEVKEERYNRLMEAQLEIVRERNQQMVDDKKQLEVVVEGLQDGNIVGRYYGQCPDIDGQVIVQGNSRVFPGERYMVELTGFDEYDLVGKVL